MERETVPLTVYNATEVPERRLYEIMAENDRLRAALRFYASATAADFANDNGFTATAVLETTRDFGEG